MRGMRQGKLDHEKNTKKHEGTRSRPTHHQNGCAFGCGGTGIRGWRGWRGVSGMGFVWGDVAAWKGFVLQRFGGAVGIEGFAW